MTTLPTLHERIARCSRGDSPLLLRLRGNKRGKHGYIWLRVHENGDLELSDGNDRADIEIMPLAASSSSGRRDVLVRATHIYDELRRCGGWRRDLTLGTGFDRYYPVQAFVGTAQVLEGFIGVEHDMGVRSEIFGLDESSSAWGVVDDISTLLDYLPGKGS